MWEFLTTVATTVLNKESYMMFIVFAPILIVVGALATYVYFSYTGSTLKFKKDKVV